MNFKKIGRILLKTIGFLLALLILYVATGLILQMIPVNKHVNYKAPNDVVIYIKSNGVHTDIVVPVKNNIYDWSRLIQLADAGNADTSYHWVSIGWGDKGFYLQSPEWKDLKLSVALKAAFHLSSSALHATFYKDIVEDDKTVKLNISAANYKALVQYIENDFDVTDDGKSIHIESHDDGYGDTDVFYEAKGSYSFFYTCNSWSNNALKAAGQPAAFWALMDKGIFRHYKN